MAYSHLFILSSFSVNAPNLGSFLPSKSFIAALPPHHKYLR
ncbi:hypothetical protein D593_1742 [Streptococcus intermedius BA1]|nr:hypothetical protein D593_1742 [Streptococcus intermedius BA1]